MAILMALAEPRLNILAITTVVGNTNLKQCIINVLKTLRVVNSKVSIETIKFIYLISMHFYLFDNEINLVFFTVLFI